MGYAVPGAVDSVDRLPPAIIVTAGFDPLLDEGTAYGRRLADSGVPVTYIANPSLLHGFLEVAGAVPAASSACERIVASVSELIDRLSTEEPATK
jgi:acetyl esterase